MKQLLFTVFLLVCASTNGQDKSVTQSLSNFTQIKGYDGLSINLIKSSENKAVISGENVNKVSLINNDGVLKVRMQLDKMFGGYKTFVDIYYSGSILVIDVNEDAKITTNDIIKQDILELKAQEGGELVVAAEVEQLLVKSVSGGVINTVGTADLQDVQINTGGIYKGKSLKSGFSTINVNAGSLAEIYATDYVKAAVKAGGEVLVFGNPKKFEEKTVFGGIITKM